MPKEKGTDRFRTMYSPSVNVELVTGSTSKVQDSFRDMCNINRIVAKYHRTGVLDHVINPGRYQDVSRLTDYKSAMDFIIESQEAFDSLPAKVRKYFQNDTAQFLEFVDNPENYEQGVQLGLFEPRDVERNAPVGDSRTAEPAVSDAKAVEQA